MLNKSPQASSLIAAWLMVWSGQSLAQSLPILRTRTTEEKSSARINADPRVLAAEEAAFNANEEYIKAANSLAVASEGEKGAQTTLKQAREAAPANPAQIEKSQQALNVAAASARKAQWDEKKARWAADAARAAVSELRKEIEQANPTNWRSAPTYLLLADAGGQKGLDSSNTAASAGVGGAVEWPDESQQLAIAIRGGTATTLTSPDDFAANLISPSSTQFGFRGEYHLRRQAWWHKGQLKDACPGGWCFGITANAQGGKASIDATSANTGAAKKVSAIFLGAEIGPEVVIGLGGPQFAVDFSAGGLARGVAGEATYGDYQPALKNTIHLDEHHKFWGGYASLGFRTGAVRTAAFLPWIHRYDSSNSQVSGLHFLITVQVQAQLAESGPGK